MRPTPFLVLFLSLIPAGLANSTLAHLPGTQVNDAKTDGAGNVYITGSQGTAPATHAFVAKLSPSGTVLYSTTLAGSQSETASAIDIDPAGNAYVLGWSTSPDFPTTPGALQTTLQAKKQCFLAKVNPNGKVVYATFIGDNSGTTPSVNGLVVNSAGEVLISGQTSGPFPSTPGAPFSNNAIGSTDFIAKIDATGAKLLAAIRGIGGLVALDAQGNAYVAGIEASPIPSIPTTPGAFQNTHAGVPCGGNGFFAFSCIYQYVTKFDANLTKIVYSTYLDGSWGATPVGISVDSQGNVWVAGTTNSPDYPITASAYQPWYLATAQPNPCLNVHGCSSPPPLTGFITQLNATGTGLIASTFFGGSLTDTITFAALAADGIDVSGTAESPDLPGFVGFPEQCLPQAYAVRVSVDATEIGTAREVPGQVLAYDGAANVLIVWTGTDVVAVDPMAPGEPITCILDAADLRPVTSIAPGELLSIFGRDLGYGASQVSGHTVTLGGSSVSINGITSPLLYVGAQQINLQVPFEIAGAAQAAVEFTNSVFNISDSLTLSVVASNPAAFVDTTISFLTLTECPLLGGSPFYSGFSSSDGLEPVTLNEDGTRNACGNPAAPGSVVRVFLDGLGVTSPPQATGATVTSPGPALNEQVTVSSQGGSATVASVSALPGLISGVWQIAIRLPTDSAGTSSYPYFPLSLSVAGVPVRDTNLTIWLNQ